MKKTLLILLITISSLNCFSQISFEKGYFINNSDQKVECLIKNTDWKNNPVEFYYKLSENTKQKKESIESVKEFGIYKIFKYSRHTVDIDRSSKVLGEMSREKNPIFKKEQLFLKTLIEGKASLFEYQDRNISRFFYTTNNTNIKQLIFKNFKNKNGDVNQNNWFRQQLMNDLKCENISVKKINKINYRKKELINLFITYNQCNNLEFKNFESKQKKDLFNLTLRLGLNSTSLAIQNSTSTTRNTDFGNQVGFRMGVELEFILPSNKNKWAILIEPTYQQFKSEREILGIETLTIPIDDYAKVEYKSIEIPIGFRHYMFLNEKSKLFFNGSVLFDLNLNSKIDFERFKDLEIKSSSSIGLGLGYKYDNKYSLECRFSTSRNLLSTHTAWSSDYKSLVLTLGYTIF